MEPDAERLAQEFVTLCEIASPSRSEAGLCRRLQERFKELHADYIGEDRFLSRFILKHFQLS